MAQTSSSPHRSRPTQLFSTILFIAAIGFAVAAAWVWYTDNSSSEPSGPPTADSIDKIDLAQVLGVLQARDDGWDYSRNPATASTGQFSTPGQALKHGDTLLFVFIFNGADAAEKVAAREAASERIDLDAMTLTTPSGTVINADGEPLRMAEHSNVLTILVGGDDALASEIAEALTALP